MERVSTSPSCQVYITPDGSVEIVSTHEQVRRALSVYETACAYEVCQVWPSCTPYSPVTQFESWQCINH